MSEDVWVRHFLRRCDVSTNEFMDRSSGEGRRNRSWPEALKREIVAASLEPGVSVSMVARRYDVNANQVFNWRRLFRDCGGGAGETSMVPVVVRPSPGRGDDAPGARIEIALDGGYRIHVGDGVRAEALRLVLDVLERR